MGEGLKRCLEAVKNTHRKRKAFVMENPKGITTVEVSDEVENNKYIKRGKC
jgi:hypothetical protein